MEQENIVETQIEKKPKNYSKVIAIIIIIAILCGGGYYYYYKKYNSPEAEKARIQKDIDDLVVKVSKHIILPPSDSPVVFDVTDPVELVKNQTFFIGSETGDKLLIYPIQAKAIIYSPRRDVIVNVGPVTFSQTGDALQSSGTGLKETKK